MSVALFLIAFIALFFQVLAAFLAAFVALHQIPSLGEGALILILVAMALLVAYGHLVFIALLHRRLRRQGRNLRIPNAISRVLARLIDGMGYAL